MAAKSIEDDSCPIYDKIVRAHLKVNIIDLLLKYIQVGGYVLKKVEGDNHKTNAIYIGKVYCIRYSINLIQSDPKGITPKFIINYVNKKLALHLAEINIYLSKL